MADNYPRQYRRAERDILHHIEQTMTYYEFSGPDVGTAAWRIEQQAKHDVLELLRTNIERGDHRRGKH